jgi:tetratricopeptide (TPR) repeat protein
LSDTAETARAKGEALLDLGRPVDAEPLLRSALLENPKDVEALGLLARCLLVQGRADEATEYAQEAIAATPDDPDGHYLLALARAGTDEYGAAERSIRAAIERAPLWSPLYALYAGILLAQARPGEAAVVAERARSLDPENAGAATQHAAALLQLRRLDEAEEAIAEALRLDPESDVAYQVAGTVELARGGGKDAVAHWREALRLDPTDEVAREGLAAAMKTRNPLYGQLVRFWVWESRLSKGARLAILFAPLVANDALRSAGTSPVTIALIAVVVGLVVLTWAIEPIMSLVLLASRYGRSLVGQDERTSALVFLGFVTAGVVLAFAGLVSGGFLELAFGLGLFALSVGSAHDLREPRRRRFYVCTALVGAVAVVGAVFEIVGWEPGFGIAILILFLAGLAAMWFVRLAS